MSKIKIGVLGCANIAQRTMIPTIINNKNFELIAIASRDAEKAEKLAKQFGIPHTDTYEGLTKRNDIDALYIPLPIALHKEWMLKGLENQKHILCEKSLTSHYSDTIEVIAFARSRQLLVMENFMFTYHSQHKYIKELVASGEIGEIRCFRSSFGFPPFKDSTNIRYQAALGGGALLDAGAYTVKAAQLFFGHRLKVATANLYIDQTRNIDLWGSASLQNEESIGIQLSFGFDNFYQCNYELWGSKGKIIAHRSFTAGPGYSPLVSIEHQGKKVELHLPSDNHFANILDAFSNAIDIGTFEEYYAELSNQSRLLTEILNYDNNKV